VTRHDDPLPNGCMAGDCSLREAVLAANANCCAQNTVLLDTGSYGLPLGGLTYQGQLKITGKSAATTKIEGDGVETVLSAESGASIQLLNLEIDAHGVTALETSVSGDTLLYRIQILDPDSSILTREISNGDGVFQVIGSELRSYVDCGFTEACLISDSSLRRLQVAANDNALTRLVLDGVIVDGNLGPGGSGVVLQTNGRVEVRHSTVANGDIGFTITAAPPESIEFDHFTFVNNGRPLRLTRPAAMTISDSLFSDNVNDQASGNGSAALWIHDAGATCTVTGSTFVGNAGSAAAGGAVLVDSGAALTIRNSTFSGNTFLASGVGSPRGAAIGFADDAAVTSLTLQHVTIVPPTIAPVGVVGTAIGGYGGESGLALTVLNSIVRGSCGLEANAMDGAFGNLESSGNSCQFPPADNSVSVASADLKLGSLTGHGGPTPTYRPAAGSVAIDAGNPSFCLATDQRGYPRPFGATCDIGAVEADDDVLFKDGFE
jgi:hypothetical protein